MQTKTRKPPKPKKPGIKCTRIQTTALMRQFKDLLPKEIKGTPITWDYIAKIGLKQVMEDVKYLRDQGEIE